MLHWKNKPIDQLSKEELKQALADSVVIALKKDNAHIENADVLPAFVTGIFSGMIATALITYLCLSVFS